MEYIKDNLLEIEQQIKEAARGVGRNPGEIKLVAVTKTVDVEKIKYALAAGVTAIGENRVQEALSKYEYLPSDIEWHLIGSLQTNKVKQAVKIFDCIHSVDRVALADEINKQCLALDKTMDVLVQVNVSGEESKHGIELEEAEKLIRYAASLPALKVRGLMTIAPLADNPEEARPFFRGLKKLQVKMQEENIPNLELEYLSMGMTDDFMVAIEEGATIVRIGSGIFGARKK